LDVACTPTGYFTSRPTSKGYIRQATAYLAAARQLQVLGGLAATTTQRGNQHSHQQQSSAHNSSSNATSLDALEFAVSLTQHHDAGGTGTCCLVRALGCQAIGLRVLFPATHDVCWHCIAPHIVLLQRRSDWHRQAARRKRLRQVS
jgi:hypothetical protein